MSRYVPIDGTLRQYEVVGRDLGFAIPQDDGFLSAYHHLVLIITYLCQSLTSASSQIASTPAALRELGGGGQ